ncbi:MAG: NifU-like domain-containing protein [Monoraphidium minutum]|nr:MAG: NifU-like domain-containing protein [Monoraphidium minutum]
MPAMLAAPSGAVQCVQGSRRPAAARAVAPGGGAFRARAAAAPPLPRGARVALRATPAAPTTDDSVPEGHKGLHATLYEAGDAATAHVDAVYQPVEGEDDGGAVLPAGAYLAARDGAKPPGVFAVYDAARTLQYVGYSRNIVLSLKTLRARIGEERVAHVRVLVVANQAMQTRTALSKQAQSWLDEAGATPPGNGDEAELWAGGGGEARAEVAAMSPAELAAYEDKKLKMIKAMGEAVTRGAAAAEADEAADTPEERRRKMILAMEGGDWSAVIDEQTRATLPADATPAAVVAAGSVDGAAGGAGPMASPFSRAGVHRKVGEAGAAASPPEMTIESVTAALVEVRPYLQADGGDVEVVAIADGMVSLRLEGACSTCAASSATLKMGIERALKAAFGDALKGVLQVDKVDTSASVASVDDHLNVVRPAINGMGGAVEVVAVAGGTVTLRYKGPPPLAKGLIAAVKDKFPEVTEVTVNPW